MIANQKTRCDMVIHFGQNNKENRDEEKRALILREWKTAFTLKHRLLELTLTGKMS